MVDWGKQSQRQSVLPKLSKKLSTKFRRQPKAKPVTRATPPTTMILPKLKIGKLQRKSRSSVSRLSQFLDDTLRDSVTMSLDFAELVRGDDQTPRGAAEVDHVSEARTFAAMAIMGKFLNKSGQLHSTDKCSGPLSDDAPGSDFKMKRVASMLEKRKKTIALKAKRCTKRSSVKLKNAQDFSNMKLLGSHEVEDLILNSPAQSPPAAEDQVIASLKAKYTNVSTRPTSLETSETGAGTARQDYDQHGKSAVIRQHERLTRVKTKHDERRQQELDGWSLPAGLDDDNPIPLSSLPHSFLIPSSSLSDSSLVPCLTEERPKGVIQPSEEKRRRALSEERDNRCESVIEEDEDDFDIDAIDDVSISLSKGIETCRQERRTSRKANREAALTEMRCHT